MLDNRKRVLEMLAAGKISVDEASKLLAGLGSTQGESTDTEPASPSAKPRFLLLAIHPNPEGNRSGSPEEVVIRVPLALIRAGMRLTSLIPGEASSQVDKALQEKGIRIERKNIKKEDVEGLLAALSGLEVDIDEGKGKIRVYTE